MFSYIDGVPKFWAESQRTDFIEAISRLINNKPYGILEVSAGNFLKGTMDYYIAIATDQNHATEI